MAKDTLSVFDHFWGFALKELNEMSLNNEINEIMRYEK